MSRTKGSKNRPKFAQMVLEGLSDDIQDYSQPSVFPGISEVTTIGKFIQNEVTTNMEITHSLKTINQGNIFEINQDLKERFFDKGWRLFATHFGGIQPEGMIIIYIFIRENE